MRLGDVLRKWRRASDRDLRAVAAEIGISHGTLSRIERGQKVDSDTMLKLLVWLIGRDKPVGRA
ncbi:MAG TPA: helix-turn-helix transcriptional regulator [Pyrinomonadaceae bacterium]|nr:helix-turn-helix transcriptional regulator [Pyrinomonadaceae bacterium]